MSVLARATRSNAEIFADIYCCSSSAGVFIAFAECFPVAMQRRRDAFDRNTKMQYRMIRPWEQEKRGSQLERFRSDAFACRGC